MENFTPSLHMAPIYHGLFMPRSYITLASQWPRLEGNIYLPQKTLYPLAWLCIPSISYSIYIYLMCFLEMLFGFMAISLHKNKLVDIDGSTWHYHITVQVNTQFMALTLLHLHPLSKHLCSCRQCRGQSKWKMPRPRRAQKWAVKLGLDSKPRTTDMFLIPTHNLGWARKSCKHKSCHRPSGYFCHGMLCFPKF